MIKKEEFMPLAVSIIIFSILLAFNKAEISINDLPYYIVTALIIILAGVFAKKIAASCIDVDITHKIWDWQRYGIGKGSYLKQKIPVGLLLPVLLGFISLGFVKFLTFLSFEAKALPSKAVKRYGQGRFSGIMEWDDALIVFYGAISILLVSLIAKYLVIGNFPFENLSKYALYYTAYNLIPFSTLDGAKLFFGSRPLFVFTWIIVILVSLFVFL